MMIGEGHEDKFACWCGDDDNSVRENGRMYDEDVEMWTGGDCDRDACNRYIG